MKKKFRGRLISFASFLALCCHTSASAQQPANSLISPHDPNPAADISPEFHPSLQQAVYNICTNEEFNIDVTPRHPSREFTWVSVVKGQQANTSLKPVFPPPRSLWTANDITRPIIPPKPCVYDGDAFCLIDVVFTQDFRKLSLLQRSSSTGNPHGIAQCHVRHQPQIGKIVDMYVSDSNEICKGSHLDLHPNGKDVILSFYDGDQARSGVIDPPKYRFFVGGPAPETLQVLLRATDIHGATSDVAFTVNIVSTGKPCREQQSVKDR